MGDQKSSCASCASVNVIELAAEACLHFPGLQGLDVEPLFIFPKIVVCLDCGFMWSRLEQAEIQQARNAAATFSVGR